MKEAVEGYEIKVGDRIRSKSWLRETEWEVYRVTPKRAYIKYNEVAEGKFPRIVKKHGFRPISTGTPYSTVTYKVFIK